MKKNLLFATLSIIGIFAFLIGVYALLNKPQKTIYPEVNKIKAYDHLKWSDAKKKVLVEYSDFQCPACKNFHEMIKTYIEASQSGQPEITKNVTYVFRHFQLYQIHPHAFISAYAAEAAGRQGKFFEMADLLFAEQENWSESTNIQNSMVKLAEKLKLNIEQFKQDLNNPNIKSKVDTDLKSGENADINSTPTYFLNGRKLNDITTLEDFIKLLNAEKP